MSTGIASPQAEIYDEKDIAVHSENLTTVPVDQLLGSGHAGEAIVKSRFDELSIPRTLWIFRRVVLITLAVYTGYMCEGFEVSHDSANSRIHSISGSTQLALPPVHIGVAPLVLTSCQLGAGGSVIANAGFIKQFGDGDKTGVRDLNPTWGEQHWALGIVDLRADLLQSLLLERALKRRSNAYIYLHKSESPPSFTGILQIADITRRFTDRFGRKRSFYLAWVWLVVVRLGFGHNVLRRVEWLTNTSGVCVFEHCKITFCLGKLEHVGKRYRAYQSKQALAKLCNGAGIGILQSVSQVNLLRNGILNFYDRITCQVYIMEIAPNRIRGGLIVFQPVWSNVGGIIVSVMMQQLNQKHPDNYLLATLGTYWAHDSLLDLRTRISLASCSKGRKGQGDEGSEAIVWKCRRLRHGGRVQHHRIDH